MSEKVPQNLEKKPDARRQNILTEESLGWAKELMEIKGSNDRTKLKEELDSQVEIKSAFFNLGDSKVDKKLANDVDLALPDILVGSVDSTAYEMKWHDTDWYKPFVEASSAIERVKGLFDKPTLDWYNSLSPAFESFRKLDGMNEKDYKKSVKKEIWDIVRKNGGDQMIYGAKGLFNFVLAYSRVESLCPTLAEARKNSFLTDVVSAKKIKLVVGKGKGEKEGAKDRFAYAAIRKGSVASGPGNVKVPDSVRAGNAPQIDPQPKDTVKKPDAAPVKPAEAAKIPAIGTPEFFAKYEIVKNKKVDEQADFMRSIKVMDDFLNNKDRGVDFLKRKDWLVQNKNDDEFPTRMIKLFAENGEIYNVRTEYMNVNSFYEKFSQDPANPDAYKYANLFVLATLRFIDYQDKYLIEDQLMRNKEMRENHQKIIEVLAPFKKGDHSNEVLKQLIDSSKYLFEHTDEKEDIDDEEGFDKEKWKKLMEGYKTELDALDKK